MTVKYAKWIGGLSSGTALSVGTAWDVTYALGAASRLGPGDELRICDTSQYTMLEANKLRVKCGSGTPSNKVRIVGADSSGNPFRGLGLPIPVLAGDVRATWGTDAAVSPAMLTIDSVDGGGVGNPIQNWEIEDLIFDGVDGKPYTGIANQGAANTVFNNHSGTLRNCQFLNTYHNTLSLAACSDSAGLVAIPKGNLVEGGVYSVASLSSAQGIVIPRVVPTARGGYILRNVIFEGNGVASVGILMLAATSEWLVEGCAVLNCTVGIRFPTLRNTNSAVKRCFVDKCATGFFMSGPEDIVEDCLVSRSSAVALGLTGGSQAQALLRVRNTSTTASLPYSNDGGTTLFVSDYRSLGGNPIRPVRSRNL